MLTNIRRRSTTYCNFSFKYRDVFCMAAEFIAMLYDCQHMIRQKRTSQLFEKSGSIFAATWRNDNDLLAAFVVEIKTVQQVRSRCGRRFKHFTKEENSSNRAASSGDGETCLRSKGGAGAFSKEGAVFLGKSAEVPESGFVGHALDRTMGAGGLA